MYNLLWCNRKERLTITTEGAGAGGRAMMFRCSNLNAVQKLAGSTASFKHSAALGNDMFKAQLIKRYVNSYSFELE